MDLVNEFVLKGKPSEEGYNSTHQPFFTQSKENVGEVSNNIHRVNELLNEISLPLFLIDFYRHIKNPDIEYYYGNWILFSLTNIKNRHSNMKEIDQHRVIEFSLLYIGIGYIIIDSIDPIDNKIFFRRDGGSDGYNRIANWDFIKNYTPKLIVSTIFQSG